MSLSELRSQAAGDQSEGVKAADELDVRKVTAPTNESLRTEQPPVFDLGMASAPAATSPRIDQPPDMPYPLRVHAPWRVRYARWVIVAAVLLASTGLLIAYFYIQSTSGPSPFDHIDLSVIRPSAIVSAGEEARSSVTVGSITFAPKPDDLQQSLSHTNPVVARATAPKPAAEQKAAIANGATREPSAQFMISVPTRGALPPRVTHTNPIVAPLTAPVPAGKQDMGAQRRAKKPTSTANKPSEAGPQAKISQDQPTLGACTEPIAALGLCASRARRDGE